MQDEMKVICIGKKRFSLVCRNYRMIRIPFLCIHTHTLIHFSNHFKCNATKIYARSDKTFIQKLEYVLKSIQNVNAKLFAVDTVDSTVVDEFTFILCLEPKIQFEKFFFGCIRVKLWPLSIKQQLGMLLE